MIVIDGISLRQGGFALSKLTLEIPAGKYGVLMGRTGCGKTSLLEAVAGLRPITAGRIELNGIDVTAVLPADRNVGYVPQDGALFRTKTVYENLAFALEGAGLTAEARATFASLGSSDLSPSEKLACKYWESKLK